MRGFHETSLTGPVSNVNATTNPLQAPIAGGTHEHSPFPIMAPFYVFGNGAITEYLPAVELSGLGVGRDIRRLDVC